MKSPLSLVTLGLLIAFTSAQAVEVDTTFQASFPNGTVHTLAVDPEGRIFAGGEFATVNGQSMHSLAKLGADGSVDPDFSDPGLEGPVLSLALGSGGDVYAGGRFQAGIAQIRPDGTVNELFTAGPINGRVTALGIGTDGKLAVGGSFWSLPDRFAARLQKGGGADPTFASGLQLPDSMEAGVETLAVQADGKVIVGGNFNIGSALTALTRLNVDGSVDPTFNGNSGKILYAKAVRVLADERILVAGMADSSGAGFVRRLNSDGSVDLSFADVSLDGCVEAVAVDQAGRIVIGGWFKNVNGTEHQRLARLNADGTVDASWTVNANNVVKALACGNGYVLAGGAFSEIGGVAQSGLARVTESSAFRFKPLAVGVSGEMHLSLKAEAGRTYVIESSQDLKSWSVWKTNTATIEGVSVSANTATAPKQFFRARLTD